MAEDFRAVIRVELDSGTLNTVKSDIEKIKLNPIKISLDTSEIKKKIGNLKIQPINVEINNSKALNSLDVVQKQIQHTGENTRRRLSQVVNQESGAIRTYANNAANTIDHMRETLAKMKFSSSSIDTVTADLERMNLVIENVTTRINGRRLNMSIKGIDEIGRAVTIVKEFDYQSGEILNVGKTISQSFDNGKNSAKEFKSEVNSVFNELKSRQKEIEKIQLKLVPLDTEKDIEQIKELRKQSTELTKEYNDLYNQYSDFFTSKQKDSLDSGLGGINRKLSLAHASATDKSVSNVKIDVDKSEVDSVFNELKSKQSEIKKIQLKLVSLDAEKDIEQIKELRKQSSELTEEYNNLHSQYSNLFTSKQTKALNDDLDSMHRQIALAHASKEDKIVLDSKSASDDANIKSQLAEYRKLQDLVDKINNSKTRISDLEIKGGSQEQIKSLTADLEKLQTEYNELRTVLSGQLSDEQLFKLDESIDKTVRKIDEAKAKTRDGIISKIDDGTIDEQINKIENDFNKLKNKSDGTAKSISELKIAAKNFDKTADTDTVIREYNELEKQIKKTAQAVDGLSQEQKEGNRESLFGRRKAKLNLDIETWLNKNTSASGALVSQIKKIQSEINAADKTTFNNLEAQFKGLTREAQATGQVGLSTIDRLKKQFSNLGVYMSAAAVISRITSALRDMYNIVVKVDDALTELKKVSGASDAQLNITFENSKQNAKEYASSLSDMINATADWSRMGYSLPEAEELAKVSTLYKNVGDNIDIDTANNSLISTLQGFKLEANDAESIINKFNEVANNYAIDSAGIGEALQRSAATFNAANTGLSKSIALITGTNEVAQDPTRVGNMWKTVSMRIRGAKQELIEAGEDTEGMVESTAQLRDLIKGITGFDIMADEAGTQFKDIYDIVVGIGEEWENLSDIDQAGLLEALAGKTQGNLLAAALGNIDTIKNVYQTAEFESDGSAQKENAAYLDSVSGKLANLQLAWENLSTTFLNSDFLKFAIEGLTELVNIVDSLVGTLGSLGTITLGANIGNFIKNYGKYSSMGAVMSAVDSFGVDSNDIEAIKSATEGLSAENTAAALSYTKLSVEQQVSVLTGKKVEQTIAEQLVAQNSLSTANRMAANAQGLLGRATTSLANSFHGLKAAIMSNPIGFIVTVVSSAISIFLQYKASVEEARQETIAAGEKAVETGNNIYELATSYMMLNEAVQNGTASSDSLIEAQNEIMSALHLTGLSIDEIIAKYGSLEQAIIETTTEELRYARIKAIEAAKATKDTVVDEIDTFSNENTSYEISFSGSNALEESMKAKEMADSLIKNGFEYFSIPVRGKYASSVFVQVPNVEVGGVEDLKENLDYLTELSHYIEQNYGTDNNMWDAVNSLLIVHQDQMNNASESIKAANEIIAQEHITANMGDIPKTLDDFIAYRDKLVELVKTDSEFDTFNGTISAESIVDNVLSQTEEYQQYLSEIKEQQEIAEEIKTKQEAVIKSIYGGDNVNLPEPPKVRKQIEGLSSEDLEIAYKISAETDYDSFDELLVGIEKFKQSGQSIISETDKISFSSLFAESEDGNAFVEGIDSHIEKVNTLKEAWTSFQKGDFSESAFIELTKQFPELADNADDLDTAIIELLRGMDNDIAEKFKSQLEYMDTEEDRIALENLYQTILKLSDVSDISIDINVETEKFSNLYSALSESVSATGMTSESIKKVNAMFSELEGYDPSQLFERTENGIHMNVDALRNLQKQYDIQKKQDIDNHLKNLQNQYKGLTDQINKATSSFERAKLISQRDNLADDITAVADLATQYDGLTSAYNRWIQAQSDDNERSMYEGIIGGKDTIEDLISRGWAGSDEVRSYIDLISAEDLSNATVEEVMKAYEKIGQEIGNSGYSLWDFLTVDEDGNSTSEGGYRFFDAVKDVLGETYAWIDENGFYNFDFGQGKDEEVAKALGMDVEYLQSILRAMSDAGFKIHMDAEYSDVENFITDAETARDAWKSLIELSEEGKIDFDVSSIDLNAADIDSITSQIENVQGLLSDFRNADGTINTNLEGAEELRTILIDLITKKREINSPVFIGVDASQVDSEAGEAIELLQNIWNNYNDIEINTALGVDTSNAQGNIRELVLQLSNLSPEIKTKLNLDNADFNAAVGRLQASIRAGVDINPEDLKIVETTLSGVTSNMMVEAGIDDSAIQGYNPDNKTSSVQYTVNQAAIDRWTPPTKTGIARYTPTLNSYTVPTLYGNLVLKSDSKISSSEGDSSEVDGTAHHLGTAGRAFSQGNWGIKGSGIALGGELGMEILVRNGKYYTIGENSAEFFKYQPNDIIFNAEQSKELLEKGKITRSKKRGKAFADGSIPSSGKAFSRGGGGMSRPSFNTTTSSTNSSSNSSNSSNSSSTTDEAEEFLETIDWIEVAIDRIERAIDTLDLKASSTYRDWSVRNKALTDEIGMISDEIDLQQKAYTRYMQEANSVGLSADYVAKVQNGTIDIEKITDEALHEQIENYQNWYEKAIDCRDAVDDLTESLSECYKIAFDNIITQYEGIFSRIELEKNLLEEYIGQAETKGYIVSVKYYQMLMERERDNIGQLQQQKAELEMSMENALKSGAIKKGSEEWNNMSEEIRNVTYEIEQGNSALIEYAKNIQDIKWETFDFIQERVANLSTETQFLVELLSNSKLYTDKGQFTSEGKSVAGLHAVDYNTYMSQADDYAKEMQKINAELAKDPANIELEKRRDELLKLQQESIMAAEDEKQAIVDMVKEGIELELSSLQDLIDTHNEALDSAKDLYDYQNKVKEQTSEISSLQKQLQAYSGDTSEETRTTIQKLQVSLADAEQSLEETQYDKYISDSKKMMDELYLDYETTLNKRLDNIDGLISDIITAVNDSQVEIASTLYSAVDKVGYTMSEATTAIWGKAYETTQAENQQRLEQVQSVVNKLEESKTLASTDANSILTAIGSGNVQNVNDTIEIIKSLTANGNITTNMRDELLSSLNVNNPKTALESLGLIGTLEESGKLSHDDANALREAVATGNTDNAGRLASIAQQLIDNGDLSTAQAAEMISAITGTNETNVSSALNAINALVKDNQLSEYEAHTLMTSLIDDNAKNLEDSANIIGGLIANGKIEAENASDIISAFIGSATANDNISNALQIIDDLSKSKKLTNEEINTLVGGIMGGNTSGLEGIITQLIVNKDISSDKAAEIVTAVGNSKIDISTMQSALQSVNTLLTDGKISINEAQSIVEGLTSNSTAIGNVITQLIANKNISSQDAANIITAVGNSKIDISTMQGALESVDTLLKNGKISISEAQSIIDGLTGNSTAIGGIAANLISKAGLSEEVTRITSALGEVNTKTDVGKLESSLDSVSELLNNGSISLKEAGSIVTSLLGGESDGVNGIIHNLVENGKLTSSEAANLSNAIETAKPDMSALEGNTSGLKDVVSTYGDKMNNSLTTTNDSLKDVKALLGDINGDLVVNVRDAAALANALSTGNTDTLSSNADFNGDGKIDVRDTAAIARYLATLAPKSYATGVKNLNKDQLAWTQENGGLEYIIRPSDGAILTPLAKNDSVLNASASSNLWSVANNPEQFIRDNLGLSAISTPTVQKSAENTYNGDMNFSVTLPNVQNYEQFKYAMQRDKSFERFIRSVSVDRLFGKSSISKYKT